VKQRFGSFAKGFDFDDREEKNKLAGELYMLAIKHRLGEWAPSYNMLAQWEETELIQKILTVFGSLEDAAEWAGLKPRTLDDQYRVFLLCDFNDFDEMPFSINDCDENGDASLWSIFLVVDQLTQCRFLGPIPGQEFGLSRSSYTSLEDTVTYSIEKSSKLNMVLLPGTYSIKVDLNKLEVSVKDEKHEQRLESIIKFTTNPLRYFSLIPEDVESLEEGDVHWNRASVFKVKQLEKVVRNRRNAHRLAAQYWDSCHNWVAIPTILLATLAAFAATLSEAELIPEKYKVWTFAVLAFLSATLGSVKELRQYKERKMSNVACYRDFSRMSTCIVQEIKFPEKDANSLCKEISEMIMESVDKHKPEVPEYLFIQYELSDD